MIPSHTLPRRLVLLAGFSLLAVSLIRTAWVADDAFISLRTADNLLNGYGPVWNVDERVQAYTHPLWLILLTVSYAVVGNGYFSTIAISLITTIAAVWVLAARLASTSWNLALCLAALLSSKAFIDYATSGLENPLSNLLVLAFVWQWWDARGRARLLSLAVLGALVTLNRLDLFLIVAPVLLYESWRTGVRNAWRPMLIGWTPFIAWELFSLFYYGLAVPNTALAKLTLAMPSDLRFWRGIDYVMRTIESDPATLPVIALATIATIASRQRAAWPLVVGILLYIAYVVRIGGDFMMGRFFVAPFIVAVALLSRADWSRRAGPALSAAGAVIVLGLAAPWEPALLSGYGYSSTNNRLRGLNTPEPADGYSRMVMRSVVDERRRYSEYTGLLIMRRDGIVEHGWKYDGFELRAKGPHVVARQFVGMTGFYAGPAVHIVDELALADPLLARIPGGDSRSLMGHLTRVIPEGYLETVQSGRNQIADRDLAIYYDALHEVVSAPLWSPDRLRTLVSFVAGGYDRYLNAYLERHKNDPAPEIH